MAPAGSSNAPEARARARIDAALVQSGWTLQDRDDMNLAAASAIAVREFKLEKGHGYVDYMLFLDGHPVGVCEAKPAGTPLTGVEHQVKKYVAGIPEALAAPYKPLPFAYLSTGEETLFINHFDPHPRTRPVFSFSRTNRSRTQPTCRSRMCWRKK
ncbi:MAG: type I restriction endonuclease [Vicinamibacteria bacterium]